MRMKRVDAAQRIYNHGERLLRKYKALARLPNNDDELAEVMLDLEANSMAAMSLLKLLVSIDDGETLDEVT